MDINVTKKVNFPSEIDSLIKKSEKLLETIHIDNNQKNNVKKKLLPHRNSSSPIRHVDNDKDQKILLSSKNEINSHIMKSNVSTGKVRKLSINRVNDHNLPLHALSLNEWENEIARHIVSMYASTTVLNQRNMKRNEAVLDFVDVKRNDNLESVRSFLDPKHIPRTGNNQTIKPNIIQHGVFSNSNHDDNSNKDDNSKTTESRSGTKSSSSSSSNNHSIRSSRSDQVYSNNSKLNETSTESLPIISPPCHRKNEIQSEETLENHGHDFYQTLPKIRKISSSSSSSSSSCSSLPSWIPLEETITDLAHSSVFRHCQLVKQRDGTYKTIRSPPAITPIWFISTGDIHVVWSNLPNQDTLQSKLDRLYEQKLFKEYLSIIEQILETMTTEYELRSLENERRMASFAKDGDNNSNISKKSVKDSVLFDSNYYSTILCPLWHQLITTAIAMTILCIERQEYDHAIDILNQAMKWAHQETVHYTSQTRRSLKGHIHNTFAYYFYMRHKLASAKSHSNTALKYHEANNDAEAVAATMLELSCVEITSMKFKEAHKTLYRLLAMVEDGRLGFDTATPKHLCIVAVAYHNLAIVQIRLDVPDLACKSSQNARKISRLCLSYSNRWITSFQRTHEAAIEDVKYVIATKGKDLDSERLQLLRKLIDEMYRLPPNPQDV